MTKVLALYLPQFHRIKENDQWWGEGFTEWNVVRNAKRLSKESIQPRVPLNGYYDLSEKQSIVEQTELAKKYRIDGFVLYSYYSNGELLLQTPSHILKDNKDINIEYCFSWANHDWMRTWYKYNKEMLRKQEYANSKNQIIDHFNYLLDFFKDSRYIKINNKPVMIIYDYKSISNFNDYKSIWNEEAIKNGFDGVFFVQTLGGKMLTWDNEMFDACFNFEPTYTTFLNMKKEQRINRFKRLIKKVFKIEKWITNYFDYNKVCDIIEKRTENDKNHYLGIFAEWDNTPRHSYNGTIFKNFSIERFKKCFYSEYLKSTRDNKDLLIIDAWNEWGEGAFLEPDNFFNYDKLKAISDVIEEVNSKYNED